MAKRRKIELTLEPFPTLEWDEFFWSATINLPAWNGFQCRHGPEGSRRAGRKSDGSARISVTAPHGQDLTPPSPEQANAYGYLIAEQKRIRDAILDAVFYEYPSWRDIYIEGYALEDSDQTLSHLDRKEQLKDLVRLTSVHVHAVAREKESY